jgi:uncharacterized protein YbjT (DUF2867 family)
MTNPTATDRAPVLVTGATGSTGQALWQALARRGVPARAMVRKAADVDRFTGPATDAVVADFDDESALATAVKGIERAYLVTPSSERAEAQQLGFVETAARGGVRHLVVLSQLGAAENSPVRFLRYHAVVERRVRELGLGHTFLRPNLYFQGLFAFGPSIARDGAFGAPIGEARVSAIDVLDIGEVAATVLASDALEDATLTLTGPQALTHEQMAESLSTALGRTVTFSDVPADAFAAALDGVLPPWQVAGLGEDYAHYRRGEAEAVSTAVEDVTGRPPRTFAEFARDNAAAFSSSS